MYHQPYLRPRAPKPLVNATCLHVFHGKKVLSHGEVKNKW